MLHQNTLRSILLVKMKTETTLQEPPQKNGKAKNSTEKIYPQLPPQKSIFITYLLWLFGGFFGLHHLYLGNDLQAFIWWATIGGYFGIAWIGEIFKIPEMVRDANEDPAFIEKYVNVLRLYRKPQFSTSRFLFGIMVGYLWAQLFILAIPQEKFGGIDWGYLHWFVPLVGSLGIYMVGNIGRERGVWWHCLLGAYVTYPIRYVIYDESYWLTFTLVVSALVFDYFSKDFDRQPRKRRSLKKRCFYLSIGICIYLSVWIAFFYFNGKISDGEGEEIPVHEALHNFFASSWWTDLKQTLSDIYTYAQHHGWYEIYKQIIESLDVDGEQKAYKVLGLLPTASQSEITSAWRALSKENHPDKVKDDSKKREAQVRFMEIQQAYEVLSKIKNKRRRKNKKFTEDL